jgi:hypothetical protein
MSLTKIPNFMPKSLNANKLAPLKRAASKLILLAILVNLSACASHYGAAKITSTPPGAQIISDGSVAGTTPMTLRWKNENGNRQTVIVKLKKAGYYEKTSSFWLDMRARNAKSALANPLMIEIEMQKIGE